MEYLNFLQKPLEQKQQIYLYGFVSLLLLIGWPIYSAYLSPIAFPFDDTYIVLHNAQVLHQGYDSNYPGVPALAGATSIIHTLLVSLFFFWLTPLKAMLFALWLALLGYVLGLLRLAFYFNVSLCQTLGLLLSGLLVGYIPLHLLSGLETSLAMAAITWSLVLALNKISTVQRLGLAILCGLMPLIRPELIVWSGLLWLYQTKRYYQQQSLKFAIFNSIKDGFIIFLTTILWLLIEWHNTGSLFPSTINAKLTFFALSVLPLHYKLKLITTQLGLFIVDTGYVSVFGTLCLLLLTSLGRIALLFIVIFCGFYTYYFSVGITFNYGRYLYLLLPLLLYGITSSLYHHDKIIRKSANFLLLLLLTQALWFLPKHWQTYLQERQFTLVELNNVVIWLKKNIPSNSILLIHDAGYLAYASHFQLVDMVGLKTPKNIYYHQTITLPSHGAKRSQAIAAIIKAEHPDYLVVKADWNKVHFNIANQILENKWHLQLLRSSKEGYSIYQILSPLKFPLNNVVYGKNRG